VLEGYIHRANENYDNYKYGDEGNITKSIDENFISPCAGAVYSPRSYAEGRIYKEYFIDSQVGGRWYDGVAIRTRS
jgi:hypothetical protein